MTHPSRLGCVLLAWSLCAAATAADDPPFTACMARAAGVTAAMHGCIGQDLRAHDERLNGNYSVLRNTLAAERRAALQRAQRDWIRFRDSNCALRQNRDGGTLAGVAVGDCKRRMTRERADELAALMPPR